MKFVQRRKVTGRKLARITTVIVVAAIAQSGLANGPTSKADAGIARVLTTHGKNWVNAIIRVDDATTPDHQLILRRLGVDTYRRLPVISSLAVRGRSDRLTELARYSWVRRISIDDDVKKTDAFTVGSSYANTAYSTYGATGSGVTVAVVDSGIASGEADFGTLLSSRVIASANFTSENSNDNCGHGTHVAGIVAGNGSQSSGPLYTKTFLGIARSANLVSVKVLDTVGAGTVSQVVSGIQWCITNATKYKIRVINLSLGHPVGESAASDPLCQACEQAWKAGIVVVCAAGNGGRLNATATSGAPNSGFGTAYGSVECPGNDPYVITVGAMKSMDGIRADDRIASYSGRGPTQFDYTLKPDLVAPGNLVISVEAQNSHLAGGFLGQLGVPYSYYQVLGLSVASPNYLTLSGTSMATPVVSGAAAMMLQLNSKLTPDEIKVRLMASATKWTDVSGNADPCTYGAGYINIPAAIASTLVTTQYAESPSLSVDASGDVYINMNSALWGESAIWGTSLTQLQSLYGSSAIWGTNTISSSSAIWGTSVWSNTNQTTISSAGVDLSSTGIPVNGE